MTDPAAAGAAGRGGTPPAVARLVTVVSAFAGTGVVALHGLSLQFQFSSTATARYESMVGRRLVGAGMLMAVVLVAGLVAHRLSTQPLFTWAAIAAVAVVGALAEADAARMMAIRNDTTDLVAGFRPPAGAVESAMSARSDGVHQTKMWDVDAGLAPTCASALAAFEAWADAGTATTLERGPTGCRAQARRGDYVVRVSVRPEPGGGSFLVVSATRHEI